MVLPDPPQEIVCPKCGERQPPRILCRECAVDMSRFREAQTAAATEARAARLTAVRAASEVRPRARRWPMVLAIALCVAIGVTVVRGFAKKPVVVEQNLIATTAPGVEIYTTQSCSICAAAKAYMRERQIRYTEYDVEDDISRRKEFYDRGGRGVPLIFVGDKSMQGFSPDVFERLRAEAG